MNPALHPYLPYLVESEALFWKNVLVENPENGSCWPWIGWSYSGGYGQFLGIPAHRYSWAIHNGMIPHECLVVCHDCDFRPCVNPSHLTLGTYKDNVGDVLSRNRRRVHAEGRDERAWAACSRCGIFGRWPVPYQGELIGKSCLCWAGLIDANQVSTAFVPPAPRWDRGAPPVPLAALKIRATSAAIRFLDTRDAGLLISPLAR